MKEYTVEASHGLNDHVWRDVADLDILNFPKNEIPSPLVVIG